MSGGVLSFVVIDRTWVCCCISCGIVRNIALYRIGNQRRSYWKNGNEDIDADNPRYYEELTPPPMPWQPSVELDRMTRGCPYVSVRHGNQVQSWLGRIWSRTWQQSTKLSRESMTSWKKPMFTWHRDTRIRQLIILQQTNCLLKYLSIFIFYLENKIIICSETKETTYICRDDNDITNTNKLEGVLFTDV